MLSPIPVLTPRLLSPDAPTCQPCPWPVSQLTPTPTPRPQYTVADYTRAAQRCQEVAQVHPTWPTSRVRAQIARELCVPTFTLRYLLRQAAALATAA